MERKSVLRIGVAMCQPSLVSGAVSDVLVLRDLRLNDGVSVTKGVVRTRCNVDDAQRSVAAVGQRSRVQHQSRQTGDGRTSGDGGEVGLLTDVGNSDRTVR